MAASPATRSSLPDYVLDDQPLALTTRLQRVNLHLERIQREALDALGLSFADYTVLAVLQREPAPHRLAVTRLAELCLRPTGGITQLIDRLARGGLVERITDPDDRRRVLIGLTPAGDAMASAGDQAYARTRRRVLDRLSAPERDDVDRAVRLLLDVLEADAEELDGG